MSYPTFKYNKDKLIVFEFNDINKATKPNNKLAIEIRFGFKFFTNGNIAIAKTL